MVVVVDDEEHTLAAATRALRRRCQVFGAINGEEALELVRRHDVALVITDQRMPGMTGIDLLERVRLLSPHTKRAILSGYTDSRDFIDAINRGSVSRFLLKPVTAEALRGLVAEEIEADLVRPGTRIAVVGAPTSTPGIAEMAAELRVELAALGADDLLDPERVADEEVALVLLALSESGEDAAERILSSAARTGMEVVLLVPPTGFSRAAGLVRRGASDLVRMPIESGELMAVISRILRRRAAERELARQRTEASLGGELRDVVLKGRAMQSIAAAVQSVATTDATVLLLGETGVGKEVVARAIHHASRRRKGPLVPVHCAALTGTLLESELFGHEKGAFTGATERRVGRFERAHGGTLFLDEVGDIPLETQIKLLRVLQERTIERVGGSSSIQVDVRVIAATHRDLQRMVADGQFRQDLYYRIRVIPIHIPPLRERREEIRALAEHFLERFQKRDGKEGITLSPLALARLEAHDWPGNVRELQNAIERAIAYTPNGKPVDASLFDMPSESEPACGHSNGTTGFVEDLESLRSIHEALERYERHLLTRVMARHLWNQSQAAAQLGITRQALAKKLSKLGIHRGA